MPISKETLNSKLFKVLSKYDPTPLDATGKVTPMEDEADVFRFTFTKDGEEYGDVFATVDDDRQIILYYKDDVTQSPDSPTDGLGYNDSWWGFLEQLASWWPREGFSGRVLKDMSKLSNDMAKRKHMKNKDQLGEGYYPMGKKASYSDAVPTVKIVIEHSRVIEEGEQRYRNINRIFLENQEGERYLLDTKKPGIARVYARHIAEGGKVNDDRWNHVHSLCEEYSKMAGFVRATRNGQFNESAQSLVNEGIAHYVSLRESLSRMTGKRGYNAYFESWTPALMEDEGDDTNLNELFVQETLDPRIESVMPILNRIHKKVAESAVDKEMNKLAEWADSLVEEESLTSNNPVGIPEEEVDESALQAYLGDKKYGEKGMDALRKAGREHAGKEKMQSIRAKFSNKEKEVDENFINMDSQAVTTEDEMDEGNHTQQDRDLNPNDYDRPNTDFSRDPIEAGTDRIHQKISNILKRLEKPRSPERDKRDTDMGSMLEAALPWEDDEEDKDDKKPKDTKGSDGSEHGGHSRAKHLAKQAIPKEKEEVNEMDKSQTPPGRDGDPRPGPERLATPITKEKMVKHALDLLNKSTAKKDDKKDVNESEERPYVCVHAKKGKCEVKASSSYQAAQKAAQKWGLKNTSGIDAHLADVTHDASKLSEGQDDLDTIIRLIRK
jgi:hypothetical protein